MVPIVTADPAHPDHRGGKRLAWNAAKWCLVQQRLKRPGAWWTVEQAEAMLALRLNRINGQWESYWQDVIKQAACITSGRTRAHGVS
jgi:hypothetical protein